MPRLQIHDGLAGRVIGRLTPSLVGQELRRLFRLSKAAYKARFGIGIGIEYRRDGMPQLLYFQPLTVS